MSSEDDDFEFNLALALSLSELTSQNNNTSKDPDKTEKSENSRDGRREGSEDDLALATALSLSCVEGPRIRLATRFDDDNQSNSVCIPKNSVCIPEDDVPLGVGCCLSSDEYVPESSDDICISEDDDEVHPNDDDYLVTEQRGKRKRRKLVARRNQSNKLGQRRRVISSPFQDEESLQETLGLVNRQSASVPTINPSNNDPMTDQCGMYPEIGNGGWHLPPLVSRKTLNRFQIESLLRVRKWIFCLLALGSQVHPDGPGTLKFSSDRLVDVLKILSVPCEPEAVREAVAWYAYGYDGGTRNWNDVSLVKSSGRESLKATIHVQNVNNLFVTWDTFCRLFDDSKLRAEMTGVVW